MFRRLLCAKLLISRKLAKFFRRRHLEGERVWSTNRLGTVSWKPIIFVIKHIKVTKENKWFLMDVFVSFIILAAIVAVSFALTKCLLALARYLDRH